MLHIEVCNLHLRAFPVVIGESPFLHGGIGKSLAFQVLHGIKVLSALFGGFTLQTLGFLAVTFPQEIMDHGGLFGVDREEWEKSPQFHEKVMERQEHQQEREQAFLSQNRDCFAIYQVSRDDPQNVRFMNLDWLKSHDISIDRSNYDLIYTAPLRESGTVPEQLEKLYEQFNLQKPADFHSPSMSVSDIVAIKQDGKVSCHYCDSVGFTQIPGFLPENPLKNAEMAVEDDYGMIDGIINNGAKEPTVAELEQQARNGQPISLMDLATAAHREEREKKKSVMEQLKSQPKAEHKKIAPKKSAEREI